MIVFCFNMLYDIMYYCDGKAEFSVFTQSLRDHSNDDMLNNNYALLLSIVKTVELLIFCVNRGTFLKDSFINRSFKIIAFIWNINVV